MGSIVPFPPQRSAARSNERANHPSNHRSNQPSGDEADPAAELESSLREEVRQMKNAALSRHDIAIAQGMLMLRHGLNEAQAFAILSQRSKQQDTHVRTVAKDVTAEMRSLRWPSQMS
jgi:hypothetical protein